LLLISLPQMITELCTYTTSGVYLIFILYSYYVPTYHRDISTVFEEIKHIRSRAPEKYLTRLLK
jgi:hypothetical protein